MKVLQADSVSHHFRCHLEGFCKYGTQKKSIQVNFNFVQNAFLSNFGEKKNKTLFDWMLTGLKAAAGSLL